MDAGLHLLLSLLSFLSLPNPYNLTAFVSLLVNTVTLLAKATDTNQSLDTTLRPEISFRVPALSSEGTWQALSLPADISACVSDCSNPHTVTGPALTACRATVFSWVCLLSQGHHRQFCRLGIT